MPRLCRKVVMEGLKARSRECMIVKDEVWLAWLSKTKTVERSETVELGLKMV